MAEPDSHAIINVPPMQIAMMPQSNKSPFAIFNEPTSDEILISLDNNCIVVFCDGSTYPNPGIGGAGLVIQDPNMPNWLELEYPITGITTTLIPLCKFVINAIFNKWDSDIYKLPIIDCQKILKSFNEDNVPEIYWIKGHSGIPGNDKVDLVANNARRKESQLQTDLNNNTD
ncbi:ribonuclease H [Reticulomyxa filosa]|uniref:Ribonuclease H n=1 Tax=Reticulomyxa filosa TaxID=46433 RepID=X6LNI5_RETFI|nr:ribonuclease H [Reticulomyxa filosa]|eukprot:ETO03483.1 ribonuclease H [Reticulomyxa filosa]